MTLIEVVLGLTIFSAFASTAFLAIGASAHAYRTENVAAHLAFLARKSLDDVGERLRATDFDSISPAPVAAPSSAATIEFQTAVGFKGGATEWGPVQRLTLEADPGDPADTLDNDGDGLVDEGRLVWLENVAGGRRTVLCSQVSASLEGELPGNGIDDNENGLIDEGGFCLEFTGSRVIAHLTLEERDPAGRMIRQSSTRTITPRNTPEE